MERTSIDDWIDGEDMDLVTAIKCHKVMGHLGLGMNKPNPEEAIVKMKWTRA